MRLKGAGEDASDSEASELYEVQAWKLCSMASARAMERQGLAGSVQSASLKPLG